MTRPTSFLARPKLRYGVAAMLRRMKHWILAQVFRGKGAKTRRARLLNQVTNFEASIFGEQFEPLKSCCELHEPPGGCEQGRCCPLRNKAKAGANQTYPGQIRLPTKLSSWS